jgi:peptidoglycan/LPS O-acetylase OafA/YrhL
MSLGETPAGSAVANRMPHLDALRGAAALAVVWHHFYVVIMHGLPINGALRSAWSVQAFMAVGRWGALGVPVFFVLSGYCVGRTWTRSPSWGDFFRRRLRRIFPAYYASLALVAACALAAKLLGGVNDVAAIPPLTPANALATLTLFTTPASATPTVAWVYWSLTYEVTFYIVLALALALPARLRAGALVWLSAAASGLAFFPHLAPRPGLFFFCDLWPIFALGLAGAFLEKSRRTASLLAVPALVALVAVNNRPYYAGFVFAAAATAGFIWLGSRRPALPRLRSLERIGVFSYSLYLVHVPLLLLIAKHLLLRPSLTPAALFFSSGAILAALIAAAFGFYLLCERPFLHGPNVAASHPPA